MSAKKREPSVPKRHPQNGTDTSEVMSSPITAAFKLKLDKQLVRKTVRKIAA